MSYYWIGDQPVTELVLVPTRAGQPIDLGSFDGVSAVLVAPDAATTTVEASISGDGDAVEADLTGVTFNDPGLWQLRLTLVSSVTDTDTGAITIVGREPLD